MSDVSVTVSPGSEPSTVSETVLAAETAVALVEGQSALANQQAATIIVDAQQEIAATAMTIEWLADHVKQLTSQLQTQQQQMDLLTSQLQAQTEATEIALLVSTPPPSSEESLETVETPPTDILETSMDELPIAQPDAPESAEPSAVEQSPSRRVRRYL